MQRNCQSTCQLSMKIISLFVIACFCFSSCKKDIAGDLKKEIQGKWEYVTFVGYPFNYPTLPAGNGRLIVFGKNGSFERRNFDTINLKGYYFLSERKDCSGNEKLVFITTTDSSFSNNNSISVKGDSLFLSTPNCLADGGTSIYRRILTP
jgi:hypothetical protein